MATATLPATIAPFNTLPILREQDDIRDANRAVLLWLAGFRSENTRRAYRREVEAFAAFTRRKDVAEAVAAFLALDDGKAHAIADAWKADKLARGLAPATINRSMVALNSLCASARRHGFTALRLEARGEKSQSYRDTKGPGIDGVNAMLAKIKKQSGRKAARDEAIIKLAFTLGLRRGEIAELNVEHVDGERLSILGKGRGERETLTLPAETAAAIRRWLDHRKDAGPKDPLFVNVASNMADDRITGTGVYHIIRTIGASVGLKVRPHGIRHTAITAALDCFNGDYRKVKAFSRHSSVDIIIRYDDNRADHGGQIAAALSAIVG